MEYPILKAIHLIGVVCWFAGLFYLVRLFIYHVEAKDKPESERMALVSQFMIMERRLWYGITVPSAWITLFAGLRMMMMYDAYKLPWFHVKATLLILLLLYHLKCGSIRKKLASNTFEGSSKKLRMFNEVATLYLCAIVFIAVTKNWQVTLYSMLAVVAIGVIIFVIYDKTRIKSR